MSESSQDLAPDGRPWHGYQGVPLAFIKGRWALNETSGRISVIPPHLINFDTDPATARPTSTKRYILIPLSELPDPVTLMSRFHVREITGTDDDGNPVYHYLLPDNRPALYDQLRVAAGGIDEDQQRAIALALGDIAARVDPLTPTECAIHESNIFLLRRLDNVRGHINAVPRGATADVAALWAASQDIVAAEIMITLTATPPRAGRPAFGYTQPPTLALLSSQVPDDLKDIIDDARTRALAPPPGPEGGEQ